MKTDYKYAKFICPDCGKRFRSKVRTDWDVKYYDDGMQLTNHVHCPRCEEWIPVRDRRNNS